MKIEFEDQGQDMLWLEVDNETGLITDCGPYHHDLYANKDFWVELECISLRAGWHVLYYANAHFAESKVGHYFVWPVREVIDQ